MADLGLLSDCSGDDSAVVSGTMTLLAGPPNFDNPPKRRVEDVEAVDNVRSCRPGVTNMDLPARAEAGRLSTVVSLELAWMRFGRAERPT